MLAQREVGVLGGSVGEEADGAGRVGWIKASAVAQTIHARAESRTGVGL